MRILPAADLEATLRWPAMIERLRDSLRSDIYCPPATEHALPTWGDHDGRMTVALAHITGRYTGISLQTAFPDNLEISMPDVMASFLLMDARSGQPLALVDGHTLLMKRTAAVSALASSYLSRSDSRRLLMIGAGALAPHLVMAHAAIRPVEEVLVWSRNPDRARRLANALDRTKLAVRPVENLSDAMAGADIIVSATPGDGPLVEGARLCPGVHIDLVGSLSPQRREADDAAITKARLFVDDLATTPQRTGDIAIPLAEGVLEQSRILGDLKDLARGDVAMRSAANEITAFKSSGMALADLAVAGLAFELA